MNINSKKKKTNRYVRILCTQYHIQGEILIFFISATYGVPCWNRHCGVYYRKSDYKLHCECFIVSEQLTSAHKIWPFTSVFSRKTEQALWIETTRKLAIFKWAHHIDMKKAQNLKWKVFILLFLKENQNVFLMHIRHFVSCGWYMYLNFCLCGLQCVKRFQNPPLLLPYVSDIYLKHNSSEIFMSNENELVGYFISLIEKKTGILELWCLQKAFSLCY